MEISKTEFKQFKAIYKDYATFKSKVVDKIVASNIGGGDHPAFKDDKMFYNWETIFNFLESKYFNFHSNYEEELLHKKLITALSGEAMTLYYKTLRLKKDFESKLTPDGIYKTGQKSFATPGKNKNTNTTFTVELPGDASDNEDNYTNKTVNESLNESEFNNQYENITDNFIQFHNTNLNAFIKQLVNAKSIAILFTLFDLDDTSEKEFKILTLSDSEIDKIVGRIDLGNHPLSDFTKLRADVSTNTNDISGIKTKNTQQDNSIATKLDANKIPNVVSSDNAKLRVSSATSGGIKTFTLTPLVSGGATITKAAIYGQLKTILKDKGLGDWEFDDSNNEIKLTIAGDDSKVKYTDIETKIIHSVSLNKNLNANQSSHSASYNSRNKTTTFTNTIGVKDLGLVDKASVYTQNANILKAGTNINITPNAGNRELTISATGSTASFTPSKANLYAPIKTMVKDGDVKPTWNDSNNEFKLDFDATKYTNAWASNADSKIAVSGLITKNYNSSSKVLTLTGLAPSDYASEKQKIATNATNITNLDNDKLDISDVENKIRHIYTLDKTTDNTSTTQSYNSTSKITTFTSTIGAKSIAGTVDEDTLYSALDDILTVGDYIRFDKTPATNRIEINVENEKALIYEGFRAAYLNDNRSNINAIYQAANNTFTLNLNSSLTNKITQNETAVETLKDSAFIKNVNDFDSHFTIPNESGVQTKWDNAFFNTIAADANLDTDAKKKKAVVKVMVSGAVLAIKKRLQIIQLGSKVSSPNIDKIMRAGINKWIPNFIDESEEAYRYRIILNHSNKIENEKWYQNNQMKGTISVILEIFKGNPSTTDVRYVIYENSALRPLDGNVVEWREEVKLKLDKEDIPLITSTDTNKLSVATTKSGNKTTYALTPLVSGGGSPADYDEYKKKVDKNIKDITAINIQETKDHKAWKDWGWKIREVHKYPDFKTGTTLSNGYFEGKVATQSWSSTELLVRSMFEDIINRLRKYKHKNYFLESEVDQDKNEVFYQANSSNYYSISGFTSATGNYWLQYWMEDPTNSRIWRVYTVARTPSGNYDYTKGHMLTITGTITGGVYQFNDSNVAKAANVNVSAIGGFLAQADPVIVEAWLAKFYYQKADNSYEIKTMQEIMRAADALKASYDAYKTSNDIAIGELKAHQGFGDNLVRHDLLEMGVDLANVPFFNNWNTITGMTDAQINTDLLAGRDTWSYWLDKVYNSAYVRNLNTNDYFVFQNVRGRDILLPQLIEGSTILDDIDISNSYQTFKLIFKKQLGGLVIYALGKHHSGYDYTKAVELLFVNSTNAVSKRSYPYNASSIQTALKGYLLSKLLKIKDYDDNIVDFHAYLRDEILYHNAYEVFRTNQVHFSINRKGRVDRTAKSANAWRFPDALDSTIASGVSSHTPNNEIVWNNTTKVATVKRGVYKIGWRQTLYDIDSTGDTATRLVISGTEGTDYYLEPEFDVAEGSFNAGRNSITLKFITGGIIRVEAASITIAPQYRCPESGARNSGEGHGQASLSNVVQNYFRIKKLNSGTEILNTT